MSQPRKSAAAPGHRPSGPPSFVFVGDLALEPTSCECAIATFETSAECRPGRIAGRVDPEKKHSVDLVVSGRAEWSDFCDSVERAILRALTHYVRRFPFSLLSSISATWHDGETVRELDAKQLVSASEATLLELVKRAWVLDRLQIQKYACGEGGFLRWHSEIYPETNATDASFSPLRRVLFVLLYLNDVTDGGTTDFLHQGISVKPRAGTIVLAPAGFTHTHRGDIPKSTDKYVLSSWICLPA